MNYTPEVWAAIATADRAYTRRWGKIMRAFGREKDLRKAMAAYNTAMGPAHRMWQEDVAAAVALANEPF